MRNLLLITQQMLTSHHSKKEWTVLKQQMSNAIATIESVETIQEALSLDVGDTLPFEQKKMLYEKLIQLDTSAINLQNFAWWLQLNGGPQWDSYADELLAKFQE